MTGGVSACQGGTVQEGRGASVNAEQELQGERKTM